MPLRCHDIRLSAVMRATSFTTAVRHSVQQLEQHTPLVSAQRHGTHAAVSRRAVWPPRGAAAAMARHLRQRSAVCPGDK